MFLRSTLRIGLANIRRDQPLRQQHDLPRPHLHTHEPGEGGVVVVRPALAVLVLLRHLRLAHVRLDLLGAELVLRFRLCQGTFTNDVISLIYMHLKLNTTIFKSHFGA